MNTTERDCAILAQDMRRWALGENPTNPLNHWQSTRVQSDSHLRTVYSYGRHFPLATIYPRGKRGGLILLNGDSVRSGGWRRSRTSDHQTAVQRIAREICETAPGWKTIILPISALDGAGIDGASIRPLDIRPDITDHFSHTAILPRDTFGSAPTRGMMRNPKAYDWRRNRIESEPLEIPADKTVERRTVTLPIESSDGRQGSGLDRAGIPANATRTFTVVRTAIWSESYYGRNGYETTEYDPPKYHYGIVGAIGASGNVTYPTSASAQLAPNGADIELGWSSWRHWLGDSLFTADRVSESSRPCHTANPAAPDGQWCEQCGGSLRRDGFERQTLRRRYRFLSSFDYNERAPLYFLAALPRSSRAQSVAMAIDDLAPAAVHAALARGLAVERQGDIFFIPTALDDAALANRGARRARLTMYTRGAKPRAGEIGYVAPLNAKQRRKMAQWRRREYRRLSAQSLRHGFNQPTTERGGRKRFAVLRADHARKLESLNAKLRSAIIGAHNAQSSYSYYGQNTLSVSQNRRAILSTVARARQSLDYCRRLDGRDSHGNQTVAQARDHYRNHNHNHAIELWRQAGINAELRFAPMSVWQSAQATKARQDVRAALAIYGTAHTATDVAVTPSGTFARGTVRHVPEIANERRESDHAPLVLAPDVWYLAVRNTVPRMVGNVARQRRGW
jgi:hypothetical protein